MINVVTKIKRVAWFDDRYYEMQFLDNRTEFYPSSTNILGLYPSEFLPRWRGDVGNREADARMNDAARKGTRIHTAINIWLMGGVVLFEPERYMDAELTAQNKMIIAQCHAQDIMYTVLHEQAEMIQVQRFKEWFDGFQGFADVNAAELIVYSQKHRYAGTMDILLDLRQSGVWPLYNDKTYELQAGLYVVDLKTGHWDEKYHLQTASYANGVEEGTGRQVRGTLIVNPDSDPSPSQRGAKTFDRNTEEWKKDFEDFLIVRRLYDRVHPNDQPKAGTFSVVLMREVNEVILTGFMPDSKVQEAKVGAINAIAEKSPVTEPANPSNTDAAGTQSSSPAPEQGTPLFNQNGSASTGKEEVPMAEGEAKKAELLAKVRNLVVSVYPQPIKNPKQVQGAANLMHRAFPYRDPKDEKLYIAQTFVDAKRLTVEQIEKGLPQLEADVKSILDTTQKGAK